MYRLHVVILGVATLAACAEQPPANTAVQPDTDIHETKAAHTESLMATPGVVGVAVGESDGRPCIRIYLEHESEELRDRLPTRLDGHPVEVVVTGPFRAGG